MGNTRRNHTGDNRRIHIGDSRRIRIEVEDTYYCSCTDSANFDFANFCSVPSNFAAAVGRNSFESYCFDSTEPAAIHGACGERRIVLH